MDGSEDGLPVIGKLAKEGDNGPGRLGVETGGWLVQEEKKSWLGGEFNSDGEELALLYVESWEVLVSLHCVFVESSCMNVRSRRARDPSHRPGPRLILGEYNFTCGCISCSISRDQRGQVKEEYIPSPGTPTIASEKSSIFSILITSSTKSSFSFLETVLGWRR